MVESERIGPYELAEGPDGLEIRTSARFGLRGVLMVAAGACLIAALVVGTLAAVPAAAIALAAVGLALAVGAAAARPGPDRVLLGPAGVVVEGFVGRQGTTPAADVGAIELQRRTPSGAETKRSPRPRIWQVTVRERAGSDALVRFRLASRKEADALAARVGRALDRPVEEREGLAR